MVSTRHHPKAFPEPDTPTASPTKSSSSTSSASPVKRSTANGSAITKSPSKRSVSSALTTATDEASKSTAKALHFFSPAEPKAGIHNPPPLTILWLLVSLPLVFWDIGYIYGRPHTFPGGKWQAPIWTLYPIYANVDYTYGVTAWNENDGWGAAQTTGNLLEAAGYIWYLVGVYKGLNVQESGVLGKTKALLTGRHGGVKGEAIPIFVGFVSAVMTANKTLLYLFTEFFSGWKNTAHNDPLALWATFLFPIALWIVLPVYMAWVIGREIVAGLKVVDSKRGR